MLKPKPSIFLRPVRADEFLPPISRWTTVGGLVLLSSVGIVLTLAAFLKYNTTVKAAATVRPSGEVKIVQTPLEGTIASIDVVVNQSVQQGDVIARLDRSRLDAQKSQRLSAVEQRQRQLAQMQAQSQLLTTQIAAESRSITQQVSVAQAELDRNQQDRRAQLATTQADLDEAEAALEFATRERQRYAQLVESGVISRLQLEEKQAAVSSAAARVARAQATLNPSAAPVAIAQGQITQTAATGQATLAVLQREQAALTQQQSEIQAQLVQEQQELRQIETDLQKTVVRATSDGIVLRSNLRNVDQVVQAGTTLVEIAPNNNALLIKATVATQDVNKVQVGQLAQLRINACPYPDYGILNGTVTAISPDAIATATSPATSSTNYYEVTIQPQQTVLEQGDRQCPLQAGMDADASIISRQETFLQFGLRKARLLVEL